MYDFSTASCVCRDERIAFATFQRCQQPKSFYGSPMVSSFYGTKSDISTVWIFYCGSCDSEFRILISVQKMCPYETYLNFVPFLLVSSCRQANLLPALALPPPAHTPLASLRKLPSFFLESLTLQLQQLWGYMLDLKL